MLRGEVLSLCVVIAGAAARAARPARGQRACCPAPRPRSSYLPTIETPRPREPFDEAAAAGASRGAARVRRHRRLDGRHPHRSAAPVARHRQERRRAVQAGQPGRVLVSAAQESRRRERPDAHARRDLLLPRRSAHHAGPGQRADSRSRGARRRARARSRLRRDRLGPLLGRASRGARRSTSSIARASGSSRG